MKVDYFANQGTEVYYDDEVKAIIATYKGITPFDNWKQHLDYALEIMKKYDAKKWLTDTKEAKVVSVANQKYFAESFAPQMKGSTYYVATVLAKDAFSEFGTKQLMKNFEKQSSKEKQDANQDNQHNNTQIESEYFQTREEAIEWLESR